VSEKQILDKLDDIQRSQKRMLGKLADAQREGKKSSALANASFGLAIGAVGINLGLNVTSLPLIVLCVIIACIGLAGFIWNIGNWRLSRSKR
jgi:hypothetical protein